MIILPYFIILLASIYISIIILTLYIALALALYICSDGLAPLQINNLD